MLSPPILHLQYGVVVYDWSNAKDIWANAHPMRYHPRTFYPVCGTLTLNLSSEELITLQAEMVYAQV